jgi:hypothetical protein
MAKDRRRWPRYGRGGRRAARAAGGGGAAEEPKSPAENAVQSGQFGPSQAEVRFPDGGKAEVMARAERIMGRPLSEKDLASLVGAPDDAKVNVTRGWGGDNSLSISIQHPGIETASRTLKRRGDDIVMKNDYFRTKESGGGLGSRVIGRQMEQAERLGVTRIETQAARYDSGNTRTALIGYKVWPKMGYDGPLPDASRAKLRQSNLPANLRNAKNISDLYGSKLGREWWEKHGESIDVSFDMRPGSYSRRVMGEYQAARKKK